MAHEPHPYALLLPALTAEEYAALKTDIATHGILYPVIADEAGRVLDGVHRVRIAAELGIEPPVSAHEGLSDERKLHLAVGLNMRRRHLDSDRRRELVRKLHKEERLSLRKISSITGWSKSTVDRDLKTSPFEEAVAVARESAANLRAYDDEKLQQLAEPLAEAMGGIGEMYGWADEQWKRGNWPPPRVEHFEATVSQLAIGRSFKHLADCMTAKTKDDHARAVEAFEKFEQRLDDFHRRWDASSAEERESWAQRVWEKKLLWGQAKSSLRPLLESTVPNGTPADEERAGAAAGGSPSRLGH